ncbi:hypothetical protein [Paraflavitalea speifideaquila]|uniref:hypothetical protein n=1 Tax=Paraflavitalea speifideaquila TaxID=3076558 RepID=UPI0028E676EA|nr:hypothetical protein [Paraflavitalea speifideiaquila]
MVGGRVSWPGFIVPVAVLFKTDNQGNLTTTLPFQPAPPSSFTKVLVNNDAPIQKLTKAIPAEGGTFIAGGNFQDKMDDEVYPYLLKVSKTGQATWQKK